VSGVGFWELIILLLIGLIVLGPERLPRVANQIGGWLGQARRMTRVMKRQLEDEMNLEKHLDILPPDRTRHSAPGSYKPPLVDKTPVADKPPVDDDADDTYSPAHDKDSAGTGVGDRDDGTARDDEHLAADQDSALEPFSTEPGDAGSATPTKKESA
jgi:sec-independent protein translocase protein TatB